MVLIGVLLFVVFLPIYGSLSYRFSTHDTYYSHGFLVPFVVAYLIWRKRKELSRIERSSSPWGLALAVAGLILHLVSLIFKVNFTSYMAVPVILMGLVLYLGGAAFARKLLFPIAFLVFMLPLPKVAIIGIAFQMKMWATQASTFLANIIGIDATRAGATIYYPGGSLLVGDPCSGLRSLITFLALGALFTQFTDASALKKNVLFLSSMPIALLSNLLRLTFLIVVGYLYGSEVAAGGFVHDSSGFMVFVLGFIGLVAVSRALKCQLNL